MTNLRQLSLYHRGQTRLIGKPMPVDVIAKHVAYIMRCSVIAISGTLEAVEKADHTFTVILPNYGYLSIVKVTP